MGKRFEDLTEEEKRTKFEEYLKKKDVRKVEKKYWRTAVKKLIEKYPEEYNKYLVAAGGKVKD